MKALYILKSIEGAPGEFQVLPYGEIEIEGDKPAILDEESMQSIINQFKRRGNDMVIDYEHQTLKDVQAPAAGWIKRFINKGKEGLWAVVEWTEKAREYMAAREYRYFSPVFWARKSDRKVLKIDHIALTNYPKINRLQPIVAKMTRDQARDAQLVRSEKYGLGVKEGGHVTKPGEWSQVPDDQFLDPVNYRYPCPDAGQTRAAASYWGREENQKPYTPKERSIVNERLDKFKQKFNIGEYRKETKMIKKLKKLFGLKDDAGEDKLMEAAEAIVAKNKELKTSADKKTEVVACKEVLEVLKLGPDADKEVVIAAIGSLGSTDDVAAKLSQDVARMSTELGKIKQEDLVQLALKEGKTSPEELKSWGRDLALKNPEQFKMIVLSRPKGSVIPVENVQVLGDGEHKTTPDDVQLSINKMMGVDEETWKKYRPQPVQ